MVRLPRLKRPGHATIVAYLALFVALGGAGYAVVRAPAPDGTIYACVALRGGKLHVVNRGARCRKSERKLAWNQRGVPGRTGGQGQAGTPGTPFDANATLPSGQTLTGVWAAAGAPGQNVVATIQFSPQLSAPLPAAAVHRLTPGATTPQCPGPGRAAPGQLCVYERGIANVTFNTIGDSATGSNGANRRGAAIEYSGGPGSPFADGSWAVTSP